MDWLDLLALQGTLKGLLQHHSSKALILQHSAFFIVQFSHPYMTTRKTIVLTKWTFVSKVMSLGWEDPLEKGKSYPLHYSGLKNSMDCIAHGVTKSQTELSDFHFH